MNRTFEIYSICPGKIWSNSIRSEPCSAVPGYLVSNNTLHGCRAPHLVHRRDWLPLPSSSIHPSILYHPTFPEKTDAVTWPDLCTNFSCAQLSRAPWPLVRSAASKTRNGLWCLSPSYATIQRRVQQLSSGAAKLPPERAYLPVVIATAVCEFGQKVGTVIARASQPHCWEHRYCTPPPLPNNATTQQFTPLFGSTKALNHLIKGFP
jgi:hypothetical protein